MVATQNGTNGALPAADAAGEAIASVAQAQTISAGIPSAKSRWIELVLTSLQKR